jgi:hypothetical protein
MTHQISYLAPRRETVITGVKEVKETVHVPHKKKGLVMKTVTKYVRTYTTKPWSMTGVLKAIRSGCTFGSTSQHDFEAGVAEFAADARIIWTTLHGDNHHAA